MIDATSLYNRIIDQGGKVDIPIERVSSTSFDIKDIDLTSFLKVGMAVELTDSSSKKYGYILGLSLVSGDTRVQMSYVATSTGTSSSIAVGDLSGLYISQSSGMRDHPGFIPYTPGQSGWSSLTTQSGLFGVNGNRLSIQFQMNGTSNAAETRVNLPSGMKMKAPGTPFYHWSRVNGGSGMCEFSNDRTFIRFFTDAGGTLPASSGTKEVLLNTSIFYDAV